MSQFLTFTGNSCTQKPNKAQTRRANIMEVHYSHELWSYMGINTSGVNFV